MEVWDLSPSKSYVAIYAYAVVVLGLKLTFCSRLYEEWLDIPRGTGRMGKRKS